MWRGSVASTGRWREAPTRRRAASRSARHDRSHVITQHREQLQSSPAAWKDAASPASADCSLSARRNGYGGLTGACIMQYQHVYVTA